jgi:hypothetical protein
MIAAFIIWRLKFRFPRIVRCTLRRVVADLAVREIGMDRVHRGSATVTGGNRPDRAFSSG